MITIATLTEAAHAILSDKKSKRTDAKQFTKLVKVIEQAPEKSLDGYCFSDDGIVAIKTAGITARFAESPVEDVAILSIFAHELAHLRYAGHGRMFWYLASDLERALMNRFGYNGIALDWCKVRIPKGE